MTDFLRMKPKTDEELVLAIQNGDISAYEDLVKRYQQGVYVFVMRILHDEMIASDITQDSLVKVYLTIDSIDVGRKFSTYLFEIAKNASFSFLRKQKRLVPIDAVYDIEEDESFIEQYLRKDLYEQVHASVQKLPEKYKLVLSQYYFDDMTYDEIATSLRMPVNTVRTHLKRAKEAFKKKFNL